MISQGFSLGVKRINWLECDYRSQSRGTTLYGMDVQVSDKHRRRGIASLLLDELTVLAKDAGFRIIGLEVQNTNAPAISLYRKAGLVDGSICHITPITIWPRMAVALL